MKNITFFVSLTLFVLLPLKSFSQVKASLNLVAENLVSPVALVEAPDESGRLYIVDQIGMIWVHTPEKGILPEPFLDLRDHIIPLKKAHEERGLLGLAFHPNYDVNGRVFVFYSAPLDSGAPEKWNHTTHISEFKVSTDNPAVADKKSESVLLEIDQPQDNHNGGTLAFGPDNYLYVSVGDGGGANDIDLGHVPDWYEKNGGGNGQDTVQNLLGSILRIDVDSGSPYGIPEDNPFVDQAGMDEIYAYGLRNPYRFSFDPGGDHKLIAGDAGQVRWEEIDVITKGGNYGWNVKEGTHCFNAYNNDSERKDCPQEDKMGQPLIDPVLEFPQGGVDDGGKGLVVIGGNVYRGSEIKELAGAYVFGTWAQHHGKPSGAVIVAEMQEKGMWDFHELQLVGNESTGLNHYLLGFGQNNSGELFILTTDENGPVGRTGKVYRLVSAR